MWYLFAGPALYALCNIFDKFVLVSKAQHASSYALLNGVCNLLIGAVVLIFLGFPQSSESGLYLALGAGALYGIINFLYNLSMKGQSASEVIGYIFVYPLPVAILAWIFLGESLSLQVYLGGVLLVIGAITLSRVSPIRHVTKVVWMIGAIVTLVSINELLLKGAADADHSLSKAALINLITGCVTLFALVSSDVRRGLRADLRLLPWSFIGSLIYLVAMYAIMGALKRYPVTIVTCIMTLQPLGVLIGEYLLCPIMPEVYGPKPGGIKAGALLLIALGAALLFLSVD